MSTQHEHLDAETVAAWMDGGLDATSLAAAEAHASRCDRCQTLLATVTRTLPLDEPLRAAADESRRGFGFWKWLAPLAATAAAVTVWMVVPQDSYVAPAPPAPEEKRAEAPATAAAPTAAERPVTAEPPAAPPAIEKFADARQPGAPETSTRILGTDAVAAKPDAAPARERQEQTASTLQESVTVTAAPPVPPTPAAPVIAAPSEAARSAPAPGAQLGAVAQLRKQVAPLEVTSPDRASQWRVLPGTIEFSEDGRTPLPISLATAAIVAGASPVARVCWFVGRGGLVLLATDGTNFTPLPFPQKIDLVSVSVTANDALRATVVAADGRTFQTSDSGKNWRQN